MKPGELALSDAKPNKPITQTIEVESLQEKRWSGLYELAPIGTT
jgi:hypothetical protein